MVMNAKTHRRGAPPDFALPRPNPNPTRMTDALWWLVCMRETLEPTDTENGGTYADKPGYHNIGDNLPDHGPGNLKTDHSIRHSQDRTGPWWKTKTAAQDWTFLSAQRGDYRNITKYTKRLIAAMKDPNDPRPDDVYAYTLGQVDNDRVVEGYNEYKDDAETSGDLTHNWHRHDSFRRNIVGNFGKMWQALTIDMGWTVAEWRQSIDPEEELDMDTKTLQKAVDETVINDKTGATLGGSVGAIVGDDGAWLRDKVADVMESERGQAALKTALRAVLAEVTPPTTK
jgi:hypothetical protein